ncbi:Transposase, partial [Dysosmobacter welbionis]
RHAALRANARGAEQMQAVVLSEHEPDAAVDIPQGDSSARLGHIRAPNS